MNDTDSPNSARSLASRRQMIENLALASASALVLPSFGCVSRRAPSVQPPRMSSFLRPVLAEESREIRTITGLRPYRPSGFVVRREKIRETTVIHNYGHGGGGITLSWGTSKLAVDLGLPGHRSPVAVLGCGAVGLATARLLQEAGIQVHMYAKALPPQTTSNIAGGQWFPMNVVDQTRRTSAFDVQLLAAADYSYRRYQIMIGAKYGIRWMTNYFMHDQPFPTQGYLGEASVLRSMMPEYKTWRREDAPFSGYANTTSFDTLLIEPPRYLRQMLEDVRMGGGTITTRNLESREEIANLSETLVFNCTGLGSKKLFDDAELTPVKGQLTVLLPQPEVEYAAIANDIYMFSRSDGILLGGTHEDGVWDLSPDLEKKKYILSRHKKLFQGLRV